jgi:hypothetical protein
VNRRAPARITAKLASRRTAAPIGYADPPIA